MSFLSRALVLVVICGSPGTAAASNYFLEQISQVITRAEVRALRHIGVRSTDELAHRGATPERREALSQGTGIPPARLTVLSSLADLMRLRGIGPDAARVMSAAGCRGVGDLQRAEPQALADEIKRVNDRDHLSKNPPRAINLVAWIAQAQHVAPLFEPDAPPLGTGASR